MSDFVMKTGDELCLGDLTCDFFNDNIEIVIAISILNGRNDYYEVHTLCYNGTISRFLLHQNGTVRILSV